MTLYPGGLDSFTPKIDFVDKIMADHVNELQAALEAIEPTIGTNPQGAAPSIAVRLDNAISSLGTEIVALTAAFHGGFSSGHGITINAAGDLSMTGNLIVSGSATITGGSALAGTTADSWTIDSDSTSVAPALVLGTTYNKRLTWANASNRFEFNDAIYASRTAGAGNVIGGDFSANSSSAATTCGVVGTSAGTTTNSAYGTMGVADNTSTTYNYGVWGQALTIDNTANGYGVYGDASSTNTATNSVFGAYGRANCGTGIGSIAYGVYGVAVGNGTRYAVYGTVGGTTGNAYGGFFTTTGATTANYAVYGNASGATTNWAGYFNDGNVYTKNKILVAASDAVSLTNIKIRVQDSASNYSYTGTIGGLFEDSAASNVVALMGACQSTDGTGATVASGIIGQGVIGTNSAVVRGVDGRIQNAGAYQNATAYGLYGASTAANVGGGNYGLYATASNGTTNWAGYFGVGNVFITDTLMLGSPTASAKLAVWGAVSGKSIYAETSTSGDIAIQGLSRGVGASANYGLVGYATGSTTWNTGVIGSDNGGTAGGTNVIGVQGAVTSAGVNNYGGYFYSAGAGTTNYGIWSQASGAGTNWAGFFGDGDVYITNNLALGTTALYKLNVATVTGTRNTYLSSTSTSLDPDGNSYTLYAEKSGAAMGPNVAVGGFSTGGTSSYGVYGKSSGVGLGGYGGYFNAVGVATTNYGIYATASGAGTNWAGYFTGNVYVSGSISGGAIAIAGTTSDTWTVDTDDSSTTPTLVLGTTYNKRLAWINANTRFEFNDAVYTSGALTIAGNFTEYVAVNDANPEIRLGSAATEKLYIQTVYDGGAQTLDYVLFQTDVASAGADKGQYKFNVDGTEILKIDDGGIEITGGVTMSGTVTGITTAITGTKNNALTISIPTQGTDDADGQNLSISAENAGSGGTGNHNGGNLVLAGGVKQGSGIAGAVTINSAWTATGQTCADLGTVVTATMSGRIHLAKGINVASANDLTLGTDGNFFTITGAVTVNAITTTTWQAGSRITLLFSGAPLIKHNTAGGVGTAPMLLAGSTDFSAATNSILDLIFDGTQWQETSRKVA